jgi:predicted amidophosphoribosyltransferase
MNKAFTCNAKIDITGATVCLVDDVYTTGTTVSECSRVLLGGGAEKVVVLTLARVAVPHRGRGRS